MCLCDFFWHNCSKCDIYLLIYVMITSPEEGYFHFNCAAYLTRGNSIYLLAREWVSYFCATIYDQWSEFVDPLLFFEALLLILCGFFLSHIIFVLVLYRMEFTNICLVKIIIFIFCHNMWVDISNYLWRKCNNIVTSCS